MSAIHPLTGLPKKPSNHPRQELLAMAGKQSRARRLEAGYDAAGSSSEFQKFWASADALDADSANSRAVRSRLVPRSRYEVANNGYTDGIHQTYCDDLIGVGPTLRMQSRLAGFNQVVESLFFEWCKSIRLRRKLWCQAHAKVQDGEWIGLAIQNPAVPTEVKLDLKLIETEQMQTPFLPMTVGKIDGITFDEFDNIVSYDILPLHPGGQYSFTQKPIQVDPRFVLHWFKLRRPGQHRGVPEFASTLQVGAGSRRFREATIGAAETAAELAALIETGFQPDEMDPLDPMSTVEFQKRMLMALPMGWKANQMKAEHPNSTYDGFLRTQISEQSRPKSMPYNKAACDSSSYNYSSGRLDHLTYYGQLNGEREDCVDLVLDPLFSLWWAEAVRVYGWNPGNGKPPAHTWDWPKHPVADIEGEAKANAAKLSSGQTTLSRVYAEQGLDFEDELTQMAADYGVSEDEMRKVLMATIFSGHTALAPPPPPPPALTNQPTGAPEDETEE